MLRLRVDSARLGGYTEQLGNFNFLTVPEIGQKAFLRVRGRGGVGEMYEVVDIVHTPTQAELDGSNEDEQIELSSVQVIVQWMGPDGKASK